MVSKRRRGKLQRIEREVALRSLAGDSKRDELDAHQCLGLTLEYSASAAYGDIDFFTNVDVINGALGDIDRVRTNLAMLEQRLRARRAGRL